MGQVMRVDRQPLLAVSTEELQETPILLPVGTGISNQIVPLDNLEDYLNSTLTA